MDKNELPLDSYLKVYHKKELKSGSKLIEDDNLKESKMKIHKKPIDGS